DGIRDGHVTGVQTCALPIFLLEIDTVGRFDTRQQFCSYARLCGAVQESAGKRTGAGNRKAGNAWPKWALSEAAVLSAQKGERVEIGRASCRERGEMGGGGGG